MYFCQISLCFSLYTLFVFGFNYEDELLGLRTLNDNLLALPMLSGLIFQTELYTNAINTTNLTWPVKYQTDLDKIRVQYAIEFMKYHSFSMHFQCSQGLFASKYMNFIINVMESINKDAENSDLLVSHLNAISSQINEIITKMLAILFNLNYIPPKWMVMFSMFFYDVQQSSTNVTGANFKQTVNAYLLKLASEATATVMVFVSMCDETLSNINFSGLARNKDIPSYEYVVKTLDTLTSSIETSQAILKHTGHESFHFKHWLLKDVVTAIDNLKYFTLSENNELGIQWPNLKERFAEMYQFDNYVVSHKHWMIGMYKDMWASSSVTNIVKQVYQIVIIRYVLVGVVHCNDMRNQIQEMSDKNPKITNDQFVDMFMGVCVSIETVMTNAIEFQGQDDFLKSLLPLIKHFVENNDGSEVSTIINRITRQLNRLSGRLDVNANSAVPTLLENTIEVATDVDEIFPWVRENLKAAIDYTTNIKSKFPHFNFKVINAIQNSASNQWIMST